MAETTDIDRAFALHMEEYKALRAEIGDLQRLRFTTAQVGLAGIVAVWSFIATLDLCKTVPMIATLGWWVPVAVALGGLLLTINASLSVRHGGAYLAMIEEVYADRQLLGWHNRSQRIGAAKSASRGIGGPVRWILWLAGARPDNALDSVAPAPPPEKPELANILKVLEKRSETPRVSGTLERIWVYILIVAIGMGIAGSTFVATASPNCPLPAGGQL